LRYFIQLSYKGTAYHGWQVQKNARSVQELVNKALSTVLRAPIETLGCGRTDTGVHALQLFAHFDYEKKFRPDKILIALNGLLPHDIAVQHIFKVTETAHARFDAIARSYEYHICFIKDPFLTNFAWHIHHRPAIEPMNLACKILIDHADFSCFSKSHTQVKTNICKITEASWKMDQKELVFYITADRFLRNMVRAIVGTMMKIGKSELSLDQFVQILESKDRSMAGMSVPAEGLYLCKVEYPYELIQNELVKK